MTLLSHLKFISLLFSQQYFSETAVFSGLVKKDQVYPTVDKSNLTETGACRPERGD